MQTFLESKYRAHAKMGFSSEGKSGYVLWQERYCVYQKGKRRAADLREKRYADYSRDRAFLKQPFAQPLQEDQLCRKTSEWIA